MKKKTMRDEAAEHLRLALPLMSKHDIPVTPRNYEVWYAYVSGVNLALKMHLDQLLGDPDGVHEGQIEELHREHIATIDMKLADRARELLRILLSGASSTFSDASTELGHFDAVLAELAARLRDDSTREDLQGIVSQLSAETRNVQAHGAKAMLRLAESQREIEALRVELEQARKQATTDALTGLANRGMFDQRLRTLIALDETDDVGFGLVLLDVDRFKTINDTHGHLVGDKVIRFVASTLLANVKGQDTAARYGGEEFAVLLPRTDLDGCLAVAEGIRAAVEKARLVKSGTREALGVVTVSAGVAVHRPGEGPDKLVDRADEALYRSKQNGRNRVSAETPATDAAHARAS